MKPRVQQKLDQLRGYPFFESVGKPLPDSVSQIETWTMAAKESSKMRWSNCRLMARNEIQHGVESQYPKPGMWERLQEWNPLAEEANPLINGLTDSLLPKIPLPDEARAKIKQTLQYDFFYMLLECELSDISEPVFFLKHLEPWYAAGRFPCGWDGPEFPSRWDGVIRHGQFFVF
jgi:hypothetical protein